MRYSGYQTTIIARTSEYNDSVEKYKEKDDFNYLYVYNLIISKNGKVYNIDIDNENYTIIEFNIHSTYSKAFDIIIASLPKAHEVIVMCDEFLIDHINTFNDGESRLVYVKKYKEKGE